MNLCSMSSFDSSLKFFEGEDDVESGSFPFLLAQSPNPLCLMIAQSRQKLPGRGVAVVLLGCRAARSRRVRLQGVHPGTKLSSCFSLVTALVSCILEPTFPRVDGLTAQTGRSNWRISSWPPALARASRPAWTEWGSGPETLGSPPRPPSETCIGPQTGEFSNQNPPLG